MAGVSIVSQFENLINSKEEVAINAEISPGRRLLKSKNAKIKITIPLAAFKKIFQ